LVSQLMFLIVINILFGFASGGSIDNAAHLGGLAAGLWLGALVPPTRIPTLSSLWQRPAAGGGVAPAGVATAPGYVIVIGLVVVGVAVVAGVAFGTNEREGYVGPAPSASASAVVSSSTPPGGGSPPGTG
jgi:hypothetical protein